MRKVLYITNIPAPYKIDFLNLLGKYVELTAIFEAKGASDQGIKFNYNIDEIENFKAIFLSNGNIREKKIDWGIFRYLKQSDYDDIIVTSYSYLTEMAALVYLKLRHIPYYMATDGGIIKHDESGVKRAYKKFLISNAKGYFSPSAASDDYLAYYGADRNVIYRYPFTSIKEADLQLSPPTHDEKIAIRRQLGMKEEYIVLGVGQFVHRKGWDILLNAAVNLDKGVGYYIVGGKASKVYLQIIEKNGLNNVHLVDFMDKESLGKYYLSADIFVLPTREDIWGLVINEAMSYGLPIITTDKCVAGIEMVSEENGMIVPADDADALCNAIKTLIYDKKQLENASCCSEKKSRAYTLENMAKKFGNILNIE